MIWPIIIYVVFLISFGIYSYFGIYHLEEFGHVGDASRAVKIIYLTLAAIIIVITTILLIRNMVIG